MRPYKRNKRTVPFSVILVKGVLLLVLVAALFFGFRLLFNARAVPPLHVDAVRERLSSKAALIARIDELEEEISRQAALVQHAQVLKEENATLKAQLQRPGAAQGILARVVASPGRSFYDTMVIDAGSAEGVSEGAVAYAFDSIALGTVASLDSHRAVIQLYSSPGRQTSGTAEGSETTITLIGRGGGEYEVRMPRDMHFSIGELISYQSIESAILAKIERIATDPRDPFQRLLAKAPVNLNALKWVIVR